jgi:hypothetical protein
VQPKTAKKGDLGDWSRLVSLFLFLVKNMERKIDRIPQLSIVTWNYGSYNNIDFVKSPLFENGGQLEYEASLLALMYVLKLKNNLSDFEFLFQNMLAAHDYQNAAHKVWNEFIFLNKLDQKFQYISVYKASYPYVFYMFSNNRNVMVR